MQIADGGRVIAARIAAVDFRIHILDIHDKAVQAFRRGDYVFRGHVQRCFRQQIPASAADLGKIANEIRVHQRFAAAEGHAAARRLKVQIIDFNAIVELLRRNHFRPRVFIQCQRIDAHAAAERAALRGDQRGNARPVRLHAQAG